jgi:hypothetical protein
MKNHNKSQNYNLHEEKDVALVANTLNIKKKNSSIVKNREINDQKKKKHLGRWKKIELHN